MTALEKGLQWERALDLFDEMKMKGLAVTVRIISMRHGVATLLAHETSLSASLC
jgi:pentatricopeptide repeat protein